MSNALKIPSLSLLLQPEHFDYTKLKPGVRDLDGNCLEVDDDGIVLFFAEYTTRRELAGFIRTAVSPAATEKHARADLPDVRDECDGFKTPFLLRLDLSNGTLLS